jgi:hypothetical protein
MSIKSFRDKLKKNLKYHIADSTILSSIDSPIAAALETFVAGITNENSIKARFWGWGLTYAGLGRLYSAGLDKSREIFHVKPQTSEKVKQIHDASYAIAYCMTMCPPFYYASGVRDFKQIMIATVASMGLGLAMGGPAGYAMDAFRDFVGVETNDRVPLSLEGLAKTFDKVPFTKYLADKTRNVESAVRRLKPTTKKCIAGLFVAGCIGATAAVYEVNAHFSHNDSHLTISSSH